jgi:photosystem II stability/assembly factor-like uncharacterized protein
MVTSDDRLPKDGSRNQFGALLLFLLAGFFIRAQAAEVSRVFRSADRGRSWSRSDQGLPSHDRVNAFASTGDLLLAGTDSGLFISRDRGLTWLRSRGAASFSGRVTAFATLGAYLYLGTDHGGVLQSSDLGKTWSVNGSFPSKNVRSLLGHQRKLYVGTDAEGVFVSSDQGRSWKRLQHGFPERVQAFALGAMRDTVFAGLYSQGLYRWDDRAASWVKTGSVSPLTLAAVGDTLVVGHNPGGIYTSEDLGATWSKPTSHAAGLLTSLVGDQLDELPSNAPVWELASSKDSVFAGAGSGIYYSEDKGRTWTRARSGLPEKSPGVAFLLNGDLILAATFGREAEGPTLAK